ncbi:TIGR03749 family integrating conjugative element protein [Pseudomonas gingeri]|uniref:TIGR03749 family integrating conjugative element protein n=1 Tax=Pseudomonas gingeri TaxID=117681 RepID=A0A7Y7YD54_9PSED|nr:TIGR03749 family integrating conjugative element protein [Pseudomonas gingeri]NWA02325.1 TIGR03749 family integrating conjugative element protein [Pseudomonas gingeri]NWA12502.1 TIGR03749 family integrating conjugative element protein [Pseudomonas gingeri]NWA57092.1 TIGR03749 family integrating conjugative element protein [Pseudomonas gingeri]NWA93435.1 TIGR03749 family integrating conjugative element protein [Pseudomonas gingeri]NWB02907.1 TIGR03749 family integrating conjugative element p
MARLNFLLAPMLALGLGCATAQAVELMTWERLPLAIPLQVGEERILFIDQNVRVGVPRSLGDKLRIQSTGGTLYLRANAPIEPTRLQLQNVQSGEIMLIDIAARAVQSGSALEPIRIVKGPGRPRRYTGASTMSSNSDTPASPAESADKSRRARETPIPVVLTRYAAQSLYAPLRTVEPLSDVVALKTRRDLDLSNLLPGQPLTARLLGAWQLDDYIVSAVRLRNLSTRTLDLDPRELQGDFTSAAFQHPYLGPAPQPSDTTVVYLVTRGRGLAQALLPSLSPVDASRPLSLADGGDHAQ